LNYGYDLRMEARMRSLLVIGTVLGISALGSAALAEEPANAVKKTAPGQYEIKIDIVGKPQRPMAAIDVAKLPVKATMTPLRQPFLGRIEQAIDKSPF
jgi:hypothetical protein